MHRPKILALFAMVGCALSVHAEPPVASYIFPAGGQRGSTVPVKVGGLNLHQRCGFEMLGAGVHAPAQITSIPTLWFEGPILPLPDSQRAEDYPKDMKAEIAIAPDAALGYRYWRLSTSQGATPARKFVVGDLPEIVEDEIDGDPVPVQVRLPLTINGRIFPRADVDIWSFAAKKGQSITCEAVGPSLGTALEPLVAIHDPAGRLVTESNLLPSGDARLRFTPPADGIYQARIVDINHNGSQGHVYRLTISADSWVDSVYPLGGRRGQPVTVQARGQRLPPNHKLTLPDKGDFAWLTLPDQADKSNAFLFDLDDLPDHAESGKDVSVQAPCLCNGRIETPGESDGWLIQGTKGETLLVELRAALLGSRLDGLVSITDEKGKELIEAETKPGALDPAFTYQFPQDGRYLIKVRDRFPTRGGPDFAYRLRLTRPSTAPDFRLTLKSDALTLLRGQQGKLTLTAERSGGLAEAIELAVDGLPEGVTLTSTTLPAKQASIDLTFKADAKAKIQVSRLTIRGTTKLGDKTITRTATLPIAFGHPEIDSALLAIALPTPFKIKGEYDMRWASRGTMHQRRYQIERTGYDGPIEVRLADRQARHLQGVTGPTMTVPAGAKEFTYPVFLPPWMETGRTSRTCVMGVATIKDGDGSEHQVSFSSVQTNEQIVAVVEPGRLSLSVEQTSVLARPGKTSEVAFDLVRGNNLTGEAKIEVVLPSHLRGLTSPPVVVAKDQKRGRLTLRWEEKLPALFTAPLTVRATILDEGRPVVAEAQLEVVRE